MVFPERKALRAWLLVSALAGVWLAFGGGPAFAAPACTTAAGTTRCTFAFTGEEQTFTVPAGVGRVSVVARGAAGARGLTYAPGGRGAVVGADLSVSPGEVLYVEVGGAPTTSGSCGWYVPGAPPSCVGGFNGGGSSHSGGGAGGGASDVRTVSREAAGTLVSRLLVAAGGGGSGTRPGFHGDYPSSGVGGDAGASGGDGGRIGVPPGTGGGAGTASGGGAGGIPGGMPGALGVGGDGGASCGYDACGGGGGGGGLYGGGGGGDNVYMPNLGIATGAGGGGGGSNLVPAGGAAGLTGEPAQIEISYTSATHEPVVMVCTTAPHVRADGTPGTFFQISAAEWSAGVDDPGSFLYQSAPAIYVEGYGTMCQLSDLVSYGGDPSNYTDSGHTVNETGDPTPAGISPTEWGAAYEYYIPTG